MGARAEEKLVLNAFKPDQESHIIIDHEVCRRACKTKYCTRICPAELYRYDEDNDQVRVEHSGCLECGTCIVGCKPGAIRWRYPRGGHGIQYRYG